MFGCFLTRVFSKETEPRSSTCRNNLCFSLSSIGGNTTSCFYVLPLKISLFFQLFNFLLVLYSSSTLKLGDNTQCCFDAQRAMLHGGWSPGSGPGLAPGAQEAQHGAAGQCLLRPAWWHILPGVRAFTDTGHGLLTACLHPLSEARRCGRCAYTQCPCLFAPSSRN